MGRDLNKATFTKIEIVQKVKNTIRSNKLDTVINLSVRLQVNPLYSRVRNQERKVVRESEKKKKKKKT